jgi:hypothetical protein
MRAFYGFNAPTNGFGDALFVENQVIGSSSIALIPATLYRNGLWF